MQDFSEIWAVAALCVAAFALPLIEIYLKLDVTAIVMITPMTPTKTRYVNK